MRVLVVLAQRLRQTATPTVEVVVEVRQATTSELKHTVLVALVVEGMGITHMATAQELER
jgi:hypothetical protein